ncbi:glycosyltransferase family 2 protein [Halorussus gelatinilyticus]|uniref:Glycosyltransferase family 2 protein n=1 Tax=Halorussus gelatinilyticus TaxID=2937524 RepID=A0A8U0IDZ9_9EURY|nr:glycosyltransferase family 2 protein [Halorussus gelatinilyticus]UPV98945.1 glycosyltransferase family 2 protein [Halorussus gelatinilyticus]
MATQGTRRHDDQTVETAPPDQRPAPADGLLVGEESDVKPALSVVMPTLNEEEGIAECIERITNGIEAFGITTEILISDSSTDRTPEIAREMGARVVEPDKGGYGYAYRYAFKRTRGDYIAIGDADTTYDFEDLPRLLEPVVHGDADMVMGSRLEGEIKPGAMPKLHQYVGNPLLTKFLNVFYGAGVSDAHSGFRVMSKEALETLDCTTTGMEFASEMIMEAGAKDLTIEEVPITYHEREGEATLESFRDGWRHVRFMLENAPGYLFSVPAVLTLALGLLTMGLSLTGVEVSGVTFGSYTMIAGSLFTIASYQLGSLAIFSAVAGNPIRKPQDPITEWVLENFKLEHGATLGVVIFAAGTLHTGYLAYTWVTSGFTQLPVIATNLVAFTALVLGLQTIFYSFFLSIIASNE